MGWKAKTTIVIFCGFIMLGFFGYSIFWYYFYYKTDDLPNIFSLEDYNFHLTTVALDDNGEVIDKFKVEDRVYVAFDLIPEIVVKAVISAEDKNFFNERLIFGLDLLGILRAAITNIMSSKIISGGSTITQQAAKLIWLNNEKSFERKFKEARIAYNMEKHLSKKLIFEIYINLVYFGSGKYGLVSASDFYFNKQLTELTVDEAATLASFIKWPSQLSLAVGRKVAISRRNTILKRMVSNGFLSQQAYVGLAVKNLTLSVKNIDSKAPYISNFLMNELHRFGYEKVVGKGLEIRTSLNSSFQEIASLTLNNGLAAYEKRHKNRLVLFNIFSEYKLASLENFKSESWDGELGIDSEVDGLIIEVYKENAFAKAGNEKIIITKNSFAAIRQDIADLTEVFKIGDIITLKLTGVDTENNFVAEIIQPKVQGAVVILGVSTGAVKAIVGGRDFQISQYNRAMQAERQAGSAFKPVVYSAYFEKYTDRDLESHVLDSPICFKTGDPKKPKWCPKNYEEKTLPPFMGSIPIKTAIARSRNVAAIWTARQTGINNVVDLARNLGISSELPRYLPIAIGAADVKVIDMANVYTTIFRQGIFKPYWFVSAIADRNGMTRKLEIKEENRVLSAEAASKVLKGMRWAVLAGTARLASKELSFSVAGKTGTTNNFTDAWFVGGEFDSPRYIVAVWVGFDRKAIPLVSRESSFKETGGSTALPIFIEIMKEIYKEYPHYDF